jgi:alpha-L-rhamnosidase
MNLVSIKSMVVILLISILCSCSSNKKVEIVDLNCEYVENPLGIDIVKPRLSWKLNTEDNDIKQNAYRILVSSDIKVLNDNIGDLWDTDTIHSSQSNHVVYDGSKLKSRQKVFWKVKVWDQNNDASSWSKISTWEMALIEKSDWQAKWIGTEETYKPKVGQKNPALYYRKSFDVIGNVRNARAYISGLGYYELYINGKKVGDHVLAPNQTNYDIRQTNSYENGKIANMSTRVLYETHDLSNYLHDGENVASVILGNGWYYQNEKSEYLPLYYDTPRFIAQIEIENTNNENQIIVSDESWKKGNGPIIDNNLYRGEIYDARLEVQHWELKKFDDRGYKNAEIVRSPEGKLQAQISPPDRVLGIIKPVSISNPKEDVYRYDFGTMFSGWVKIKIKEKRGNSIKLTFFEDNDNNYEQTDTYIFKGEGVEEWEPRFTWHSFRYIEVTSSETELTLDNIEGKIVHTDIKTGGAFSSSNKLFNRILNDYNKTQLDNMHGCVPTDCPHRERRGYTGDGQIAAQAAIYNLDMKSFYTKWIGDISDAQNKKTGYVPNTTPFHSGGGGTAWGSAYIIIPWYMYLYYNDIRILEENYDGMKKYIEYLDGRRDKDGLIYINELDKWDLGEWVPPTETVISPSYVSSAYYYYDLQLMSKISKVLKYNADHDYFKIKSDKTKDAFNIRYFDDEKNSYSIGKQGANVFALAFGLVPEQVEKPVFNSLVQNIEIANSGHFDTGMMGTPYLLEVLTKYDRADLAYTLMNQRDFPSYGYNISRGATTLWETWTGNESHSHPMFGSVTAWFYQGLGGIYPDDNNPGFKHTIIKPNIIQGLDFVNVVYPSIYGEIGSSWKYKNNDLKLSVVVPPNTTASVFIHGDKIEDASVDNSNAIFIGVEENRLHYEVPSGNYQFISKNISKLIKNPMLSIPVIAPADSILFSKDLISVNISNYANNAEIRYTLDGSIPNLNSTQFTKPFTFKLKKSTTIKARVFKNGVKESNISTSRIVLIDSVKNGWNYKYYAGSWNKLPNYAELKPQIIGNVYDFDLSEFSKLNNEFGILFSSELEIKENGEYIFYLKSNDGSKLFINEKLIINADGLHGFSGGSKKLNLSKGKHKIRLEYFQAGGGKGLELLYEGPNIEKQIVPADVLVISI